MINFEPTSFQKEFQIDGLYTGKQIRESIEEHFPLCELGYENLRGIARALNQIFSNPINPSELLIAIPDKPSEVSLEGKVIPKGSLDEYSYTILEWQDGVYRTKFTPTVDGYRCKELMNF